MGYGGIYTPVSHEGHGSSGPPDYHDYHDYDEGLSSNYNPQQQVQQGHPHGQHQDHFDYDHITNKVELSFCIDCQFYTTRIYKFVKVRLGFT